MSDLLAIIDRFESARVVVLGDFLLDEFVFGEIERVSREAPVLILTYRETHAAPGGGANTVANVASLGSVAVPVGFRGDDEAGRRLLALWPEAVEREHVVALPGGETTRKTRILAGSLHSFRQQIVRMDHGSPFSPDAGARERIVKALDEVVPEADAVVLSDYSLGTLTDEVRRHALSLAEQHDKIVVADSRDHPELYQGATSLTPNISEIAGPLGLTSRQDQAEFEREGARLCREWKLGALLVTRGRFGISLFEGDRVTHVPVYGTDEVADVTGAGDTVIATYTTALAVGASFEQAARLANCAGGIVVMKKGTATVSARELRRAVGEDAC